MTSDKGEYRLEQLLELLQRIEDRLRNNENDRAETDREVQDLRNSLDSLEDKYLNNDKTTFEIEQKIHKLENLEAKIENERTKSSMSQQQIDDLFNEYREEIKHLEERADTTERIYLTLEQKLNTKEREGGISEDDLAKIEGRLESSLKSSVDTKIAENKATLFKEIEAAKEKLENSLKETRDTLNKSTAERHSSFSEKQKEHDDIIASLKEQTDVINDRVDTALTKAATMIERLEDVSSQQTRINRRLDKAYQDKIRLERKIERMDEIITRNQEALQAKALVLLTDQSIAENSNRPFVKPAKAITADAIEQKRISSSAHDGFEGIEHTKRSRPFASLLNGTQTAAAAAIILATFAGGWFISKQFDGSADTQVAGSVFNNEDQTALYVSPQNDPAPIPTPVEDDMEIVIIEEDEPETLAASDIEEPIVQDLAEIEEKI